MTTIRLSSPQQREAAKRAIDAAPEGMVCKVSKETRRDAQNRALWPKLTDLRDQVPELGDYSLDDIKLRFLNALGVEMRFLPTLENEGHFPVGLRSSTLTVSQFSGLLDLIDMYGAKHGVKWSFYPWS